MPPKYFLFLLCVFGVSFVLLQGIACFTASKKRFWIFMDYVWLSVALFGLIGTGLQYSAKINMGWHDNASKRYVALKQSILLDLEGYTKSMYADPSTAYPLDVRIRLMAAASWAKELYSSVEADDMKKLRSVSVSSDILGGFPENSCTSTVRIIGNLIQDWDMKEQMRKDYLFYSRWADILYIAPMFLAVALSIRFGKVTADWREYKNSE